LEGQDHTGIQESTPPEKVVGRSRPPEEVLQYIERYALRSPHERARAMEFLQNPPFRSYIFNYTTGKALLAPLLEGADAVANFGRLLSEPFTPTQIRHWLAERGQSSATQKRTMSAYACQSCG